MLQTAIILAGGFGTRLQHIVSDVPKPMAPVAGRPFLEYLLAYCRKQALSRIIMSVGYKHESIIRHFGNSYDHLEIEYVIEDTPLGTGGAIKKSLLQCKTNDDVVIMNGDSYFPVDLSDMLNFHRFSNSSLTIALKPMQNFERYGRVLFDDKMHITSFREKEFCREGYINGGVYIGSPALVHLLPTQENFSFEQDVLNRDTAYKNLFGFVSDAYFIDIGVPEDYARAQSELPGK